jgi:hypothetical protein
MTGRRTRRRLVLLKAARCCRPTARTRSRGFRCMNRGDNEQSIPTPVRTKFRPPVSGTPERAPPCSAHGGRPCTSARRPRPSVGPLRAGRSPCTVRDARWSRGRAMQWPGCAAWCGSPGSKQVQPQMHADARGWDMGHRIGAAYQVESGDRGYERASRTQAHPRASACICG